MSDDIALDTGGTAVLDIPRTAPRGELSILAPSVDRDAEIDRAAGSLAVDTHMHPLSFIDGVDIAVTQHWRIMNNEQRVKAVDEALVDLKKLQSEVSAGINGTISNINPLKWKEKVEERLVKLELIRDRILKDGTVTDTEAAEFLADHEAARTYLKADSHWQGMLQFGVAAGLGILAYNILGNNNVGFLGKVLGGGAAAYGAYNLMEGDFSALMKGDFKKFFSGATPDWMKHIIGWVTGDTPKVSV